MRTGYLPAVARQLWPLAIVAVVVVGAALGGEGARVALRYDRAALEAGDWWRFLTGHIVHLGWRHVLLNLAGLGLVALLFPREYRAREWLLILAGSAAVATLGMLLLRPDLTWYVGFSGVLHGFFVAGALRWLARGEGEGFILAAFLLVKLAWEQGFGALPMSVSGAGGPVVVDAHLYGAAGGLLAAGPVVLRDWIGGRR